MTPETAEALALRVLAHILSDRVHLRRFLAVSGLAPEALRARPDDPRLLAGALDYLLANERDLIAFCNATETEPSLPGKARAALP